MLLAHHWPGNVRELKNVVERSVYRSQNPEAQVDRISLDPFESPYRLVSRQVSRQAQPELQQPDVQQPSPDIAMTPADVIGPANASQSAGVRTEAFPVDFRQSVQDFEVSLINRALAANQFNQKKTADALGVTYHQLRGYLKKYDLLEQT
jgi:psp operon transcriptional activator